MVGVSVCGNHMACIQLRAYKIWRMHVKTTHMLQPVYVFSMFLMFTCWALGVESPPRGGATTWNNICLKTDHIIRRPSTSAAPKLHSVIKARSKVSPLIEPMSSPLLLYCFVKCLLSSRSETASRVSRNGMVSTIPFVTVTVPTMLARGFAHDFDTRIYPWTCG